MPRPSPFRPLSIDPGVAPRRGGARVGLVVGLAAAAMVAGAAVGPRGVGEPRGVEDARPNARSASLDAGPVDFADDILPVLASQCFRCHGGVRERAGLHLGEEARVKAPLRSGATAVVPGDPGVSELLARITSDDPDLRMPPDGPALDARTVEAMRRWIEEGAAWGTHWAFRPLAGDPGAGEAAADADGSAAIDRIVAADLAEVGLALAPEADPETLVRRVALDLTGLPPREEVRAAYLADPSDAGYARLVDSLLDDPAYGERFARIWLDLARYADTQGYEKDDRREIWAWRDWVVAALNDDLPYDAFAVRLLAGDMLPDATDDDRVASAFHRNTLTNSEGGTDDEEFRMAAVFDRVSTTWQSFLGVTFQCVQCHGHPYDPFTHREYYEFLAYLNQTEDADRNDDAPRLAVERAGVATSVPVMRELAGEARRTTRLLARGSLAAPGEEVAPGVPAALAPGARVAPGAVADRPSGEPADRLGMARWIASPANPLFARVAANRAWETLFGRGIVETSEDLGVIGSGATNRALLDHLAARLVAAGFSQKALLREIVRTRTYRQSSIPSAEALARDPLNERWSRAPRVRLEAEQVRDQALAVTGLLSRKVGGPPVMPPQPDGVWQVVYSGDAWRTSEGEDRYRRALYTFLRRSSPYPSFLAFDATSRETCTVRRVRTNTPLAALVTLNDPVYLECAQALAVSVRGEADDARAIGRMFERALGRRAFDDEVAALVALVAGERARYAGRDDAARALAGRAADGSDDLPRDAARTAAANAILNLDDFLTRS